MTIWLYKYILSQLSNKTISNHALFLIYYYLVSKIFIDIIIINIMLSFSLIIVYSAIINYNNMWEKK